MLALALLLASTTGSQPGLAFVARYYYPPGDKRMSTTQVYVSDIKGKHRRQVTHGKDQIDSVRWVGRNSIAWITFKRHRNELWLATLPGLKPHLVKSAKEIGNQYPRAGFESIGNPIFWVGNSPYHLVTGALRKAAGVPKWKEPEGKSYALLSRDPERQPRVIKYDATGTGVELELGGKNYSFPDMMGKPFLLLRSGQPGTSWLVTELQTLGGCAMVYRIDWTKGVAERACSGYDLEFDPAFPLDCSIGHHEGYADYGKGKMVSVVEAYVDRWEAPEDEGKATTIVGGLAQAWSISLRPKH